MGAAALRPGAGLVCGGREISDGPADSGWAPDGGEMGGRGMGVADACREMGGGLGAGVAVAARGPQGAPVDGE